MSVCLYGRHVWNANFCIIWACDKWQAWTYLWIPPDVESSRILEPGLQFSVFLLNLGIIVVGPFYFIILAYNILMLKNQCGERIQFGSFVHELFHFVSFPISILWLYLGIKAHFVLCLFSSLCLWLRLLKNNMKRSCLRLQSPILPDYAESNLFIYFN